MMPLWCKALPVAAEVLLSLSETVPSIKIKSVSVWIWIFSTERSVDIKLIFSGILEKKALGVVLKAIALLM